MNLLDEYDREADAFFQERLPYAMNHLDTFLHQFSDESLEKQIALGNDYLNSVFEHTNEEWNHDYIMEYFRRKV